MLFLAMRAGDFVNAAAGMWFVPKYVSAEEIGAVLPVSSFATFISLPAFALAMAVMKESAVLAAAGERGKVKSLLGGVFAVALAILVLTLSVSALAMPRYLHLMRVDDPTAGFLVVAAAFLGCIAPVWTDALQALKRFRALAAAEFGGSLIRFATMAAAMPFKALSGYFAGQAALPVFRIAASAIALRSDMKVESVPFWNGNSFRRLAGAFAAILVYQGMPMFVSMLELSILRDALPAEDSAGYYMVSRFSDFLHYLTFPVLLVMFPYTATAAAKGESTRPYVAKCSLTTLGTATVMATAYLFAGRELLPLMPNGEKYLGYAIYMPVLTIANALTSCQVFYTNSEVSAGRFGFFGWFLPLHLAYAAALYFACRAGCISSPNDIIAWFAAAATARFAIPALLTFFPRTAPAGVRNP